MPHSKIIEQRLRFLLFDDDTVQALQQVEGLFKASSDVLLDRFYGHVLEQPELEALFTDKESINRARNEQKRHWEEILFSKRFGEQQFEQTKKVGQTHLRIRLEPSSYMSAYCFMFNEFIELIVEHFKGDPQKITQIVQALSKAVVLDMNFVIEAYIDAKNSRMKKVLQRASRFTEDAKGLADDLTHTIQDLNRHAESLATLSGKAESVGSEEEKGQPHMQELLQCTNTLSRQVEKLNSRLDELMFGDRLYFRS